MSQPDNSAEAATPTSVQPGTKIIRHPLVLRLLYTVGYAILAWLLLWFIFAVTLLQLIVTAISGGNRNEQLADFGAKLSWWMRDMVRFLTGASNELPFPLAQFPTA